MPSPHLGSISPCRHIIHHACSGKPEYKANLIPVTKGRCLGHGLESWFVQPLPQNHTLPAQIEVHYAPVNGMPHYPPLSLHAGLGPRGQYFFTRLRHHK